VSRDERDRGAVIETDGLTKRYGDVTAVDDLDLVVPAGSVFGFLGPNGAGKTTTIRMLLGLVEPTAGTVRLLGRSIPDDVAAVLPEVGALVEGPAFYPWLTGRQNLDRFDAVGRDGDAATRAGRIGEALERVGLGAAADRRYRVYSLGMRQRLGLAAALLRPRRLLVLDEPTNGMDPEGTRHIRDLIRQVAAEGVTVFLSSHLLGELDQMCSHVAVMAAGRLRRQGALDELRRSGPRRLRVETADPGQARRILDGLGVSHLEDIPGSPGALRGLLGAVAVEECCRALVEAGVAVRGFGEERPSLEELYVSVTDEDAGAAR